jgi:NitT/TauT family transport system permease protein
MSLPVLTSAISAGIKNTDKKLLAMAKVYGFSRKQKILHIYLPSMVPWFFSGADSALGLIWKSVIAGEVLTLPKGSLGSAMQTAKIHLETQDVFAWTIAVILCSYMTEQFFIRMTYSIRRYYETNTY